MKTAKPEYRWIVQSITDERGRRSITLLRIPLEWDEKNRKHNPALRFRPAPANRRGSATQSLNSR